MAEVFLVSYFHVNGLKASIKRLKLGKKALNSTIELYAIYNFSFYI